MRPSFEIKWYCSLKDKLKKDRVLSKGKRRQDLVGMRGRGYILWSSRGGGIYIWSSRGGGIYTSASRGEGAI